MMLKWLENLMEVNLEIDGHLNKLGSYTIHFQLILSNPKKFSAKGLEETRIEELNAI